MRADGVGAAPAGVTSAQKRLGALGLEILLVTFTMFVGWFIWSLRTWARGQTPAKSLLSMRCIRTDNGRAASWPVMALREVVGKWILGAVTLGVVPLVSGVMVMRSTRTTVWDRLARTQVVDDPRGLLVGPGEAQSPPSSSGADGGGAGGGDVGGDVGGGVSEGDEEDGPPARSSGAAGS